MNAISSKVKNYEDITHAQNRHRSIADKIETDSALSTDLHEGIKHHNQLLDALEDPEQLQKLYTQLKSN